MELNDVASVNHSLAYVLFPRPYDKLHLLNSFVYLWKELQFEHRIRARRCAALSFNKLCVDMFGITTRGREKFFVYVPSLGCDYKGSCILVAPTPMALAYLPTLPLHVERRGPLFCISVAESCVFTLLLFFKSALISGLAESVSVFKGAAALAESAI